MSNTRSIQTEILSNDEDIRSVYCLILYVEDFCLVNELPSLSKLLKLLSENQDFYLCKFVDKKYVAAITELFYYFNPHSSFRKVRQLKKAGKDFRAIAQETNVKPATALNYIDKAERIEKAIDRIHERAERLRSVVLESIQVGARLQERGVGIERVSILERIHEDGDLTVFNGETRDMVDPIFVHTFKNPLFDTTPGSSEIDSEIVEAEAEEVATEITLKNSNHIRSTIKSYSETIDKIESSLMPLLSTAEGDASLKEIDFSKQELYQIIHSTKNLEVRCLNILYTYMNCCRF